jgi:hypothetical protein
MKSNVSFNHRVIRLACASALGVSALFSGSSFAANTATFDVGATVIAPISITKANDLAFGRFSSAASGTVVVTAAGARSATGGVALASGITATAANFNVSGQTSATYAVTLPPETTITGGSGSDTMTVGSWTQAAASGTLGTLSAAATGIQTLQIGATLTVGAAQPAGAYTGTFTMQVDYN